MDRASGLDAAELLHDAFYRRPVWTSTSELGIHAIERCCYGDNVASMAWNLHAIEQRCGARDIWLPHRSRRHLAQLVDVRVAQVIDVRLGSSDHDLLLARVLGDARDALPSL